MGVAQIKIKVYAFIVLIFSIAFCVSGYTQKLGGYADSIRLKEYMLVHIPALQSADELQKVRLLRNYVYQHVSVGNSGIFKVSYEGIYQALSGMTPFLCYDFARTYMALLDLYGIPNRLVQLYSKNYIDKVNEGDTHASVEIFLYNKWVIEDPTFNVEWHFQGIMLNYDELTHLFHQGKQPIATMNGFPPAQERTVENYYIPYKDLLYEKENRYATFWTSYNKSKKALI